LHFFLDFLLIDLCLLLLLKLDFFVSRRNNLSNFKPNSPDLYHISFLKSLAIHMLLRVEGILDHLPQHSLWVFEQVVLLYVIQGLRVLFKLDLGVFSNLKSGIGSTVAVLVVDPPVTIAALNDPRD